MLDRLEAAQARQRRFVSDASHELRSPIASIRQHAEVALAHPERADAVDFARVVLDEDLRVQRLVDDMLFLARADEHGIQLTRRPVDLDDVVFEEAARVRATTTLLVDTSRVSGGRVQGDRERLRQLVRNLVDNATRHAATTVRFVLTAVGGETVLRVDDDGPGIPAADRERVFERFVRLDGARDRDHGGAGMGLAIVAEIAAAHGARARVTDGDGGGACVEVRFPNGAAASPSFSAESGDPCDPAAVPGDEERA
jgi:signal transduction histidine kinase